MSSLPIKQRVFGSATEGPSRLLKSPPAAFSRRLEAQRTAGLELLRAARGRVGEKNTLRLKETLASFEYLAAEGIESFFEAAADAGKNRGVPQGIP